ncbi:Hypothetical_protein [Hexamita inflata]|uniref:Hypothetical_protein n=1 Tax=Hexamita inflata TaxID=28002 RepID=A0AA86UDC6_9EUKA|nr:Hypothetical protein HINF_LOCUS34352 [Hexamita inflata]
MSRPNVRGSVSSLSSSKISPNIGTSLSMSQSGLPSLYNSRYYKDDELNRSRQLQESLKVIESQAPDSLKAPDAAGFMKFQLEKRRLEEEERDMKREYDRKTEQELQLLRMEYQKKLNDEKDRLRREYEQRFQVEQARLQEEYKERFEEKKRHRTEYNMMKASVQNLIEDLLDPVKNEQYVDEFKRADELTIGQYLQQNDVKEEEFERKTEQLISKAFFTLKKLNEEQKPRQNNYCNKLDKILEVLKSVIPLAEHNPNVLNNFHDLCRVKIGVFSDKKDAERLSSLIKQFQKESQEIVDYQNKRYQDAIKRADPNAHMIKSIIDVDVEFLEGLKDTQNFKDLARLKTTRLIARKALKID